MDPMYQSMPSYPFEKDQIHFWPHYYPGAETFPSQVHVNPFRTPISHEGWPWATNYGYPFPMACHGCCHHNYIPTHFSWRPSYSHAPPVHYPGIYPPHPVQFMPQSMREPQYEHENNTPGFHYCCGCPNHVCHAKELKNIRIEEEEPNEEKKKNDSLVPFHFKNYPYPIVWLPSDHSKNHEPGKIGGLKPKDSEAKPQENAKVVEAQQPDLQNGWWPFDAKNMGLSKQKGEDEEKNCQQLDNVGGGFPFPIVWLPYKPEGKEKEPEERKENVTDARPILEKAASSDGECNLNTNEKRTGGGQVSSMVKDIPVQTVDPHREKDNGDEINSSSINGIESVEKKSPQNDAKRNSSSPSKSSRLPPVCLRVDPLPKRKNSNGSSRSPSPPVDKRKRVQLPNEPAKVPPSSNNMKPDDNTENRTSLFKADKGVTKTIEVVDGNAKAGLETASPVNCQVNSTGDVSIKQEGKPNVEKNPMQSDKETRDAEMKETVKRKISEEEAAIIIQSAYRGFDIRRLEPIKKLKQIAQVRKKMAEVKEQVKSMELSSDAQSSGKQRNIISETVMSLLLKLDNIQGLHPSIREVRKSVVKELVTLQEKLDSLIKEKSETSPDTDSDVTSSKKTPDTTSSGGGKNSQPQVVEPYQNHVGEEYHSDDLEISDVNSIGEMPGEKYEKEAAKTSSDNYKNQGPEPSSELIIETEDEKSNEGPQNHNDLAAEMEDHDDIQPGEISVKVTDVASSNCYKPENIGISDQVQVPAEIEDRRQFDPDTTSADKEKNLEEGQVGACISSEAINGIIDEANRENVLPSENRNDVADEGNKDGEGEKLFDVPCYDDEVESEGKEHVPIDVSESHQSDVVDNEASLGKDETSGGVLFEDYKVDDKSMMDLLPSEDIRVESSSSVLEEESVDKSTENGCNKDQATCLGEIDEKPGDDINHSDDSLTQQRAADGIANADIKEHEETLMSAGPKIEQSHQTENEGAEDDSSMPMEMLTESIQESDQKGCLAKENLETLECETSVEDEKIAADESIVFSLGSDGLLKERNQKLVEENERLREMMEKLIKSGQEQLTAISSLSRRVKDLEKKLSKKKKLKMRRYRAPGSRSSCVSPSKHEAAEMVM